MSYVSPSSSSEGSTRRFDLHIVYRPDPQPAAARTPRLHQPSAVTHLFYVYVRKATNTEFNVVVLGRDLIFDWMIHSLNNFAHVSKYASESVCIGAKMSKVNSAQELQFRTKLSKDNSAQGFQIRAKLIKDKSARDIYDQIRAMLIKDKQIIFGRSTRSLVNRSDNDIISAQIRKQFRYDQIREKFAQLKDSA
ncbi:hypothetical protein F511_21763 [Dorcoceras hygrometricum]|uniref:Uncharacterized protein n=1 Tax=Dorcoceras hygrometricum TaxID=472368 RepID=A0A2Z7BRI1_9LAMI|nr:hypothetical protein F511_21763 [Dorcoceras hygrometricum]